MRQMRTRPCAFIAMCLVTALLGSSCALGTGATAPERVAAEASAKASAAAQESMFVEAAKRRSLQQAKQEVREVEADMLELAPVDLAVEHYTTSDTRWLLGCRSEHDLYVWPFSHYLKFDTDQVDPVHMKNAIIKRYATMPDWQISGYQRSAGVTGKSVSSEGVELLRTTDEMHIMLYASRDSGRLALIGSSGCFLVHDYDNNAQY